MMRTDRLPELRCNHHTRPLSTRTAREQHDSSTSIRERRLKESNSHTQSNAGTSQGTLVTRNRPRVPLKLLKDIGKLELALLNREQKAGRRREVLLGTSGDHGLLRTHSGGQKAEHLLDLFGLVILVSTEDIGFGAFRVSKLMNMSLHAVRISFKKPITLTPTMVP